MVYYSFFLIGINITIHNISFAIVGSSFSDFLLQNLGWCILLIFLLFAIIFYIIFRKKKNSKVDIMSNDNIEAILNCFGTLENIVSCSLEGSRLKVLTKDISKVDLVSIKALKAQGIFVSGNQVKLIFSFDVHPLVDYIINQKKEK
ncbi:MAG: hypothetical protein KJ971_03395 [Firmicutes bacterium]|nr:hypothetical protein [Bacillota bacterium]